MKFTVGNWITIGVFVFGLIGAALKLAHEVGAVAHAVDANTEAIRNLNIEVDDLDHTWTVRLQASEDRLDEHAERIARLEGR